MTKTNSRFLPAWLAALALPAVLLAAGNTDFALAAVPPEYPPAATPPEQSTSGEVPQAISPPYGQREARLHDPSAIVNCDGEYWLFATGIGIQSWRSKDLDHWSRGPAVFTNLPAWVTEIVPSQRGHFWAPEVIFFNGRYLLYYSVSQFGKNTSAIALASNPTLNPASPNYAWTDHGIVVQSQSQEDFNAIDPAVIATEDEELWLAFGSFWSGIKLIQLDPATGLRATHAPLHALAWHNQIEAPYVHARDGWFYLFVNWGTCCRGTNSTYHIRVGRSRRITGPFVDAAGRALLQGGGTLVLATDGPFIGPGHASIFTEHGQHWLVCHFYDGNNRGRSRLAIQPLTWTKAGWPLVQVTPQRGGPSPP